MSFQNLLHILLSDLWNLVKTCLLFDFQECSWKYLNLAIKLEYFPLQRLQSLAADTPW